MEAFIFDAYGTLFDVHSVVKRGGAGLRGDLEALSQLWRRNQLEYTWRRALMNRYADFRAVTEEALRASAAELSMPLSDEQREALMQAYLSPAVFDDVLPMLQALHGRPMAILSNGSPDMLEPAVRSHGIESYFTAILSADTVRTYKPSPQVYALGPERLKLPAREILFVSSNLWDAAGAKAFGYTVCWCNRAGGGSEPEFSAATLGFQPDFTVTSLKPLPPFQSLKKQ